MLLRGSNLMTSHMSGVKGEGKVWTAWSGTWKLRGSKSHDQQYSRGVKVTLGVRTLFFFSFACCWAPWALCPCDLLYLAYHPCSVHTCLTAYHITLLRILVSEFFKGKWAQGLFCSCFLLKSDAFLQSQEILALCQRDDEDWHGRRLWWYLGVVFPQSE